MKLFSATVYFELPDNFDGSINDAFKEVIKYRENPDRPEPVNKNKERHAETTYSELFNIWLDNVETNPMLLTCGIFELVDGEFIRLPLKKEDL